ncbi:hypothetical protein Tco_1220439 [Tanacetum coccineum]
MTVTMDAFRALKTQFQLLINFQDYFDYFDDGPMIRKFFLAYTQTELPKFRDTLIPHMEYVKKSIDERTQLKRDGTKSDKHDTSSRSGTYITHDVDAYIRPVNDQVSFAEVQLTAQHNVHANEQQHTEQSEPIYDTWLLEKDAEQYQVKNPLLNAELFKTKEMIEKETYNELSHSIKNELTKLKGSSVDTKFAKASIFGKPVLQPLRNQSFVRQPTTFRSERPKFSKLRFASHFDVKNDLPKPVTPHYLPKVIESVFVKPHHVTESSSSRNGSKESYRSNDMAHKYYLEVAKKKTQDKNTNLKPSVMHTTSLQNTTNGSKPKPRNNNQTSRSLPIPKSSREMLNGVPLVDVSRNSNSFSDSKHFVCSTCQKCVFNANHDDCITKFLKEVNSRAKV